MPHEFGGGLTNIKQCGYATGGGTEVWDAYWVPQGNSKGQATGRKTNFVYTADLARGIDVYQVDLPGEDLGETGGLLPPLADGRHPSLPAQPR